MGWTPEKRIVQRFAGIRIGLLGLLLSAGALSGAAPRFGDAWDWPLPPRAFGSMSQPERMVYERAEKLFRDGNVEAAAAEFEKFILEHPRAATRPYALLMRGYSLHKARQRNQAIAVYTEVLDLFGENLDVAVPAAYLRAWAQIENGNEEKGYALMEEALDNERILAHPLADVMLNRLAERSLRKDAPETAERLWLRVLSLYEEAFVRPENAAREARNALMNLYLREGRTAALNALIERTTLPGAEPEKRRNVLEVVRVASRLFDSMEEAARRKYLRWFVSMRELFTEPADRVEFCRLRLDLALRLRSPDEAAAPIAELLQRTEDGDFRVRMTAAKVLTAALSKAGKAGWRNFEKDWRALSDSVLAMGAAASAPEARQLYESLIGAMEPAAGGGDAAGVFWDSLVSRAIESFESLLAEERNRKLVWLIRQVRDKGSFERAYAIADRITDPGLAAWQRIQLLGYRERWAEMAEACKALEERGLEPYSNQALETRADLYRQRLGKYEEAITLYRMVNDTPRTLWHIVECYERLNQPEEAVKTCAQIEGFFKEEASRAAYRIAVIWEKFGNRARAIAAARAVLRKYPEGKESSKAHQMLERYGIDTGGGLFEAEE